jgi:methylated-DNA-[protein]-cysteine S-methyltransferase
LRVWSTSCSERTNKKIAQELLAYFEGKEIQTFSVETLTGPPFTKKCWEACGSIPYGKTISYKEFASLAGSPDAYRAAGQAMRNNPMSIITPCHRVHSSNGALHGYAGETALNSKELNRKQFLLELEQCTIRE